MHILIFPSKLWAKKVHITHGNIWYFSFSFYFLKILFIYLFLERGERREKLRERNINLLPLAQPPLGTWPATQACALTGNQTGDLSVHRLVLNTLSHMSQGSRSIKSKYVNRRLVEGGFLLRTMICCGVLFFRGHSTLSNFPQAAFTINLTWLWWCILSNGDTWGLERSSNLPKGTQLVKCKSQDSHLFAQDFPESWFF